VDGTGEGSQEDERGNEDGGRNGYMPVREEANLTGGGSEELT
jgi:hypothetical protein